jgi:hypothetical protein
MSCATRLSTAGTAHRRSHPKCHRAVDEVLRLQWTERCLAWLAKPVCDEEVVNAWIRGTQGSPARAGRGRQHHLANGWPTRAHHAQGIPNRDRRSLGARGKRGRTPASTTHRTPMTKQKPSTSLKVPTPSTPTLLPQRESDQARSSSFRLAPSTGSEPAQKAGDYSASGHRPSKARSSVDIRRALPTSRQRHGVQSSYNSGCRCTECRNARQRSDRSNAAI